ncbi:DUF3224 domain-containing protein [Vagococcus sp. BWB3-3]|uniref:DUF3224 domain-containing protein n=1 Tax=Vagococcus allomyrinae TaxID=2794353 RepID=A0A940P3T9_9ENTE|nr:DUF3224 domain-containing protein [Vagococcus allomyrinae]MBP1040942.1 DUF3224 domain-containing protein [Vagococcus allomyrinae]
METAIFTVTKWEETPIETTLNHFPINSAKVEYQISGVLEGTATLEYLLYYLDSNLEDAEKAKSKIAGFLHFEGTYAGKVGAFTASENGMFDQGTLDSPAEIIHATGELAQLTGHYNYHFLGHTSELILDFSLPN